ncbi:hypothetical protein AB0J80_18410 [Actinoplanes sp. NPDC049548]|uniref:hypothetical protein n=1 Tax=Actinoplanes sp. NPDC049548 TaxID=3155152 RepID=UPI0034285849
MAVGAAVLVLLALATAVATRPSDTNEATRPSDSNGTAISLWPLRPSASPSGDQADAGASLPSGLTTSGRFCQTGINRPDLDTVFPVLSAAVTPAPGMQSEFSFQLRGMSGLTAQQDTDLVGQLNPATGTAVLDFKRVGAKLLHGESYRWRVRDRSPSVQADGWSQWCEFAIATQTPDDLGLADERQYKVVLPAARWREILKVLGPVETYVNGEKSIHAPIEKAAKTASSPTRRVPVTLSGRYWSDVVSGLAYWASQRADGSYWALADLLSDILGGPVYVTMGFPRT